MKKMLAVFLTVLIWLASMPVLFAQAEDNTSLLVGDGAKTVTVAFNGESVPRDVLIPVLEDFYEETGISVQIIYVAYTGGWAGYLQKLQTMIVGGTVPDLFRTAIEGYNLLRDSGMCVPLNAYIDQNPDWYKLVEDNHPRLRAAYTTDGQIYGFGFDWNNIVMHINTKLLQEAGLTMPDEDWTLDEFLEYARKLTFTREDGTQVYGFQAPTSYFQINAWLYNNGAAILNDDMSACVINSPKAVKAIQFLYDCIYEYGVSPISGGTFVADQIGMYTSGRWSFRTYNNNQFKDVDIQYLPTNEQYDRKVIIGGGTYLVAEQSGMKEEAFKLACWLCSADAQSKLFDEGSIPTSVTAMEKVAKMDFPGNAHIWLESAQDAVFMQAPSQYADIATVLDSYLTLIYADEMGVEEALNACAEEIDLILQGF